MSPWRVDENADLKDNENYEQFALNIFNRAGITSVNRLDKHAYSSIILSDINNEDLSILIQKELADAEIPENGLENVGDFEGGLVFKFENGEIINHSCCGSISDYKNWLELIEKKPKEWMEIWIGHPWVYAKVINDKIFITDYLDETNSLPKTNDFKFEVDFYEFENKLLSAIVELKNFKKRIRIVLTNENQKFANELSELLIENEQENTN